MSYTLSCSVSLSYTDDQCPFEIIFRLHCSKQLLIATLNMESMMAHNQIDNDLHITIKKNIQCHHTDVWVRAWGWLCNWLRPKRIPAQMCWVDVNKSVLTCSKANAKCVSCLISKLNQNIIIINELCTWIAHALAKTLDEFSFCIFQSDYE